MMMNKLFNHETMLWAVLEYYAGVCGLSGVWERYSEFFSNFCLLQAVSYGYGIIKPVHLLTEKYFLM